MKDFSPQSRSRALALVAKDPLPVLPEAVPNEPRIDAAALSEEEATRSRVIEGRRTLPRKIARLKAQLADAEGELAKIHDQDAVLKKWESEGR